MNKRMSFFTLLSVILSASVLLGCNREKPLVIPDLQDALATYDENTITADDLVMMCSTRSHRMEILAKSVSETNWAETRLTELQQERILSERAREQGLDQDPAKFFRTQAHAVVTEGDDVRPGEQVLDGLIELHFGRMGGMAGRTAWIVLGLLPAVLVVTGVLAWWLRRRRDAATVS